MNRAPLSSLLLGLGLLLATTPAGAAHFDFEIPVELHKLPERIHVVWFSCQIKDARGEIIGGGTTRISPPRHIGEFVDTVRIPVNASPGKSAFDARSYECRLGMFTIPGVNPPGQKPGAHSLTEAKPGTPLNLTVSGTFPFIAKPVPLKINPRLLRKTRRRR